MTDQQDNEPIFIGVDMGEGESWAGRDPDDSRDDCGNDDDTDVMDGDGLAPPEPIPPGFQLCGEEVYATTPDDSRAWWDGRAGMEGWRTGDLPRTQDDIMAGRPTSLSFVTIRKIGNTDGDGDGC